MPGQINSYRFRLHLTEGSGLLFILIKVGYVRFGIPSEVQLFQCETCHLISDLGNFTAVY